MTPTVAKAAQMRRTVAAIRIQDYGDLGNPQTFQTGFDYHLAGKFHSRSAEAESIVGLLPEGTEATVGIPNGAGEEQIENPGQDGVANILVQPGHGSGTDTPLE